MKKKLIDILKYILIGSILSCFFPLLVFAEGSTYYLMPNNEDVLVLDRYYGGYHTNWYAKTSGSDIRGVYIGTNKSGTIFLVGENSFSGYIGTDENGTYTNSSTFVYNDVTYHILTSRITNGTMTLEAFPILAAYTGLNVNQSAIYYTFGAGAVDPVPQYNWGLVRDPEYSTRIAGNGYAAKRNIDYLSWNSDFDSNGNSISECSINIKAVLGSWSGTTQEDLLNKTYNDFNIGNYSSIDLGNVPASSGLFTVSWERIINEAGWNFDGLYSHFEDNIFLKQGWYYQLQLVDPQGGTHQWQTLYTPLSSSAAASETVITHNSFDTSIYQVYEELTTINNNTSITINIEDTDYTVTNPDDGDEPDGGIDLWDILKQMLNGIFQIVKNIAALPGKFLEMIQQLITPPQQISEEINTNFNNNMQDLNESQPGIMESMNAVEDIQDTLNQSVNSFNGVPECIFTWDAVTMDLSAFNAGTVTFIAAGSFDFAASFMQMINGFGMTYSEYQFYVSAIIYAWILVFIYRHVYDFLAGTKES